MIVEGDTRPTESTEIDLLQKKLTETLLFNEQVHDSFAKSYYVFCDGSFLQLKAVVLMLDEKLQDHEGSLPKEMGNHLFSSKIEELTTSLQNLKWGFRERHYN